ncbi:hypothetical protein [Acetobacter sp. P1H12_c]|uniref:hypothetical protein n=1 Tax=Acetobacter sp. P1H12_c TaxID=2762621 RepID=UPI001C052A85|nr:hypothetical protein [Acetobacter sp. P1H12_c]
MSAAQKDCLHLPGICVQRIMDRLVELVIASGAEINGMSAPEVGRMVASGMQGIRAAWPAVETPKDLLDIHTKAEAVAALAVWQLIILGAYVNAQANEMQAADAATKH